MPSAHKGSVPSGVPSWKNAVIGALSLPDLVSSTAPVPLLRQPNLVDNATQPVVKQVSAQERRDWFQLDQNLKDLADYKDILDEQQRARGRESGYALREPDRAQVRPDSRGDR